MKKSYLSRKLAIWFSVISFVVAGIAVDGALKDATAKTMYYKGKPAKYVFFLIGDGLGMPQRTAAEMFMKDQKGKEYQLVMNRLPAQGVITTHANNRFITGSAAAATAMACGVKTNIGYIGMDPNFEPVETLAEQAKKQGRKVGIISSVSIDHATPACFYAHQPSRKLYHEISVDLANSGFDFFGGGGLKDPEGKKSKKPLGNALEIAQSNGYKIVTDKKGFMALKSGAGKILAYNENLPDGKALPYDMDNQPEDITIGEFTQKAIELLDNENGFFIMVEGGKIDWACHANDAVASIKDTLAFDEAVQKAYDFYLKHPDETLIVVSGDHECGGLTLGFSGTVYESYFDMLKHQTRSFQYFTDNVMAAYKKENAGTGNAKFEDMIPLIKEYFGLEVGGDGMPALKDYELEELKEAFTRSLAGLKVNEGTSDYILYGGYDPLTVKITHILNHKAGLGWTSFSHTGVPVTTSAIGVGAETFNGYYDNTDVAKKIMAAMGVKIRVAQK